MLELRNITAGYDGQVVLRDVSMVIPDNSVVALLGPNGAGKTTLLRVASGLLAPSAGQILLDGEDVTGWSSDRLARSGVCHVPEGRGVFPGLTVQDNLRMQTPVGVKADIVGEVGGVFPRLAERVGQLAGTMSGGEQQMLALSYAYVADPDIVLLDEVSMGLAPKVVDDIFQYLERLAAQGRSLLIVEQYVARALALASYVYILRKGQVDFVGEPHELGSDDILASYLGDH